VTERVTLITGASAGIGTELARVFASNGHRLALVARRADRLEALAAEIGASGGAAPIVRPYQDSCDMFLFDTEGAGYGGTGKKFNWDLLKPAHIDKLFFLSGGIEPADVEKLKAFAKEPVARKMFSIDINSKFEQSAGVKDLKKIRTMIDGLKSRE